MKPTAVEFAVEQLEQLIPFGYQLAIRIILEQAKEMEMKQIIYAHLNGQAEFDTEAYRNEVIKSAEEYYNETFNK